MNSPPDSARWTPQWSEALSVGIPEIDAEHRQFIALVNELNDSILQRKDLAQVKRCLQAIVDDADAHFDHEEVICKTYGYANIDDHQQSHAHALSSLRKLASSLNDHSTEYQWIETGLQVKRILVDHLMSERGEFKR